MGGLDWQGKALYGAAGSASDVHCFIMGKMKADPARGESRWPALAGLIAIGFLNYVLPRWLNVGPRWLLMVIVLLFAVPLVLSHRAQQAQLNRNFGIALNAIVTLALVASVVLLVSSLPGRKESPTQLLISAGALWFSNILVFASWYWRLDGGGPHQRDLRASHDDGAFLFPQMALHPEAPAGGRPWTPMFVDYLFLAFNTSTALSPADTQVLSRWAKLMMMFQAMISLTVIVLVAARAVNIL